MDPAAADQPQGAGARGPLRQLELDVVAPGDALIRASSGEVEVPGIRLADDG
jgi:hypothetical protein